MLFFNFVMHEQLLKDIVYPLAVKSRQVLELAQQQTKKSVLLTGVARSSSLPLSLKYKEF